MDDRKRRSYFHPSTLSGFIHLILRPVESVIPIGLFAFMLFSIYAFCTLSPGVIYTNVMAHDNYVFIDGIHRIWSGHAPHLDFATALGALNFFWPAIFGLITDSEFKAFLLYQVSFLGVVLGMLVYISRTRLNYFCSMILLIYIASIIGAPVAIGFPGSFVTYAMYYNRFGWALFVVSFLMALPLNIHEEGIWRLEAFLWAFLLWISLYTKITYCIAITGIFLIMVFYDKRFSKTFIASSLSLLIGMFFIEVLYPGLHLAYFNDLLAAGQASKGFFLMAWDDFKGNLIALLCVFLAISIVFVTLKKSRSLDFPIFLTTACYNVVASLFIVSNNTDLYGLPALTALYVSGFMLVSKGVPKIAETQNLQQIALISIGLLLCWSSIPEAIERQGGLERFFRIGYFSKRYPYPFPFPEPMREMKIIEGKVGFLEKLDFNGIVTMTVEELRDHVIPPRQEIYQTQFAYMVAKGYEVLLEAFSQWGPGPVIHLDFSNPFSTLLKAPSARGEYAWYHSGRNISKDTHLAPEQVFQDAKFVMISRYPTVGETATLLREIYGEYISRNYALIHKDALWNIWVSNRIDKK